MKDDLREWFTGCAWGFFLGCAFTFAIMGFAVEHFTKPQSEAIKHGAAYYHPETGAFTWRNQETAE